MSKIEMYLLMVDKDESGEPITRVDLLILIQVRIARTFRRSNVERLNVSLRTHFRRYARGTNAHSRCVIQLCQSELSDSLYARDADGIGDDGLDNAESAGNEDLTTVADSLISRRRLSRSLSAQQSCSTRAASLFGSISLLACSAIVRQSPKFGAIAEPPFLRRDATLAFRSESEQ
jgi:hypothetical protein